MDHVILWVWLLEHLLAIEDLWKGGEWSLKSKRISMFLYHQNRLYCVAQKSKIRYTHNNTLCSHWASFRKLGYRQKWLDLSIVCWFIYWSGVLWENSRLFRKALSHSHNYTKCQKMVRSAHSVTNFSFWQNAWEPSGQFRKREWKTTSESPCNDSVGPDELEKNKPIWKRSTLLNNQRS